MEVEVARQVPPQCPPGSTYETRYIYTGFGWVDVVRKKVMVWKRDVHGRNIIFEMDAPDVLPRAYHTEHVRVTVFSESPRVWKEEHGQGEIYFFRQMT